MKHVTKLIALSLLIGVLFFGTTVTSFASELTDAELQTLLQDAVDEEYLARDTYQAVLDAHGEQMPFSRIVRSEQRHIDLVQQTAEKYGVELTQPTQTITAPATLEESLARGVEIEELDIAELNQLLEQELPQDVELMLSRLLRGSQQHLNAFTRAQSGELQPGAGRPGQGAVPGGRGMARGGMRGTGSGQFLDEDGDGICDNCADQPGMMGPRGLGSGQFIDEDGDGICDYCADQPGAMGSRGMRRGGMGRTGSGQFVDEDGNGLCDYLEAQPEDAE